MLKSVVIYSDGACVGNPGPGGYGVVVLFEKRRRELSAGFTETTNNRMELLGAIVGLESLKEPCNVSLFSDSEYVVKAMQQGWAKRWKAAGWRRGKNGAALNPDLWERLLALCERHQVGFSWVRGHSGDVENERCDRLAFAAAQSAELSVDQGYASRRGMTDSALQA